LPLLILVACQAPAGPALHRKKKLRLTSYTFTRHLIMGQAFYGTVLTRDPHDPFTFVDPFDP